MHVTPGGQPGFSGVRGCSPTAIGVHGRTSDTAKSMLVDCGLPAPAVESVEIVPDEVAQVPTASGLPAATTPVASESDFEKDRPSPRLYLTSETTVTSAAPVGAVKAMNCSTVSPTATLPIAHETRVAPVLRCVRLVDVQPCAGEANSSEPAGMRNEISTWLSTLGPRFAKVADASVVEPAVTTGFGARARSKLVAGVFATLDGTSTPKANADASRSTAIVRGCVRINLTPLPAQPRGAWTTGRRAKAMVSRAPCSVNEERDAPRPESDRSPDRRARPRPRRRPPAPRAPRPRASRRSRLPRGDTPTRCCGRP